MTDNKLVRRLAAAALASLLVAVLVTAAAPIREARADELPSDTNTVESLTVEQARKLAEKFPGVEVSIELPSVGTLPFPHGLPLNGLTKLDAEIAKALAGFNGRTLALNSLAQFDNTNLNVLAELKGELIYVKGLTVIDADTAAALVADPNWDGRLFVTALESPDSLAIAKILAARAGPVWLPKLKKLSRRTLSALMEKEDLQIPPIEQLEFIPEPAGGVNDDFPIPEGFPQPKR